MSAWEVLVSVPSTADTQAAFAATLADEWARHGISHAVVCPGSRSTPLALALAARKDIRCHVRLDERSAGFTGLGIGLATGVPAVVLTTSGTAAVEVHAAVVEADLAGVPLVVCTADRPPELRDVGAPQTIDQTHLYGRSVRWFTDPGVPADGTRGSWRSLAARAAAESRSGPGGPGPVHLNLPFREPLLGDVQAGGGAAPGRVGGSPWHGVVVGGRPPDEGWLLSRAGTELVPGRRGLIVAGAGCGDPVSVLAMGIALGWPVLADPRSGLRRSEPGVIGAADGILRSERFADGHVPECIVVLGERWVSKVVNGFLDRAIAGGAHVMVVDPWDRWPDPARVATEFVRSDPTLLARGVLRLVAGGVVGAGPTGGPGAVDGWAAEWQRAEQQAQGVLDRWLGGTDGGAEMTEPLLARRLFAGLPADATLVVSSSMPVRDVEAFAGPRGRPPRVLANRGANGIDGVVSTALGVALAGPGPTVALVGDLAFLHDVSALVGAEGHDVDLTVVVADNRGGGIFSFLEPASVLDPDIFDTFFGTPQGPDVAAVAAGFGWPVEDVGGASGTAELGAALARRLASGARGVIRVRLPGRDANVEHHRRVNAAVVQAVDGG
jgi:2-succinyl-5-enolpyruvyl-6-hydroxy-3-cyclohexene-1-carboxylate synthase